MGIRKKTCLLMSIFVLTVISSCSSERSSDKRPEDTQGGSVDAVIKEQIENEEKSDTTDVQTSVITINEDPAEDMAETEKEPGQDMTEDEKPVAQNGIDIDLTVLSSTMVYSEVYDMMYYPENYIGKTVKMEGLYASAYDDTMGKRYHACIIQDATACCSQGIEFEPGGDLVYPDDFPDEGGNVCVIGTFDTYAEGDQKYCTLRNAKMI